MYSVNRLTFRCYIIWTIGVRIERNIYIFHIQFSSGTVIQRTSGQLWYQIVKEINNYSVRRMFNCKRNKLLSRVFTSWTTFSDISSSAFLPCTVYMLLWVPAYLAAVCHELRSSGMLGRAVWQNRLPWIWGQHFSAKRVYPYNIPNDITSCKAPITNTVVTSLQSNHRAACIREIFLLEKETKILFVTNISGLNRRCHGLGS